MDRLKSIKIDLEKRHLQVESTSADILRLSLTPEGIKWEFFQPPNPVTTERSVEKIVDTTTEPAEAPQRRFPPHEATPVPAPDQGEAKEKKTHTFTGKIKGQVREGRPDGKGHKTAWARVAVHEEGNDEAKMLSVTFHRHTANLALALPAEAQITAEGYLRPVDDPARMDSFSVFHLINYPGKREQQQVSHDSAS